MAKDYQEIGRVIGLYRYPVKSMGGEKIDQVKVGWHGFGGDRRFAFLRVGNKTGLPWLSMRQFPKLITYSARFEDPTNIEGSQIIVQSPAGVEFPLLSGELLSKIEAEAKLRLELIQLWRGAFDSMAISLISLKSIQFIQDKINQDLEVERFRPNIVMELFGEKPFPEEKFVSELAVFGDRDNSARIRIFRKDPRCMVVNLHPKTAVQNPQILKEIVINRKNFLGVYGGTERPGVIQQGDPIYLVK